jgi:pilus assembly protein Flp/PilA
MIKRFSRDQQGATAIEYAVIVALIFLVIVSAPVPIGQILSGTFTQVAAGLNM